MKQSQIGKGFSPDTYVEKFTSWPTSCLRRDVWVYHHDRVTAKKLLGSADNGRLRRFWNSLERMEETILMGNLTGFEDVLAIGS